MFGVVSIAAARVAARELAPAAVPALQGAAQGARDGAGSAPNVQDLAAGAVSLGIAGGGLLLPVDGLLQRRHHVRRGALRGKARDLHLYRQPRLGQQHG